MTVNNRQLFIGVVAIAAVIGLLVYVLNTNDVTNTPTAPQNTTTTPTVVTPQPSTSTVVTPPVTTTTPPTATSTLSVQQQIKQRSDELLTAFKSKDLTKINSLVHPTKGIRFSMGTHVNTVTDKVFTRAQLTQYFNTAIKFTWGAGASGEPLVTPIKDYIDKHVANLDYVHAPEVLYNTFKGATSEINNLAQAYPNAQIIEYYFPGFNPQYQGMDWQAVRLAWEKYNGQWYVVGMTHDQWSP